MKYFPSSIYEFKLVDEQVQTIERLKRRTDESQNLSSKFTDKSFIGKVNQNTFKIVTSNIGTGAFCTLQGIINNKNGEVLVEINTPFKVLLSLIMTFPIIALITQSFINYEKFDAILILVCLGQILMIRFLFIEMFYRLLSKQSINKLSDILDTEWMKKK